MKASKILTLIALLFIGIQVSAQDATLTKETFKVLGNCEMCKTTIEKAVEDLDGVKTAKWNVSTKKISVKFYRDRTSLENIQKAIAASGYDTEKFKANEEDYNNLHSCCKYERE